jgi:hypothetical protein
MLEVKNMNPHILLMSPFDICVVDVGMMQPKIVYIVGCLHITVKKLLLNWINIGINVNGVWIKLGEKFMEFVITHFKRLFESIQTLL